MKRLAEAAGRRVLVAALDHGQAAELIETLLAGGTVTLDPFTGRLVLVADGGIAELVNQRNRP